MERTKIQVPGRPFPKQRGTYATTQYSRALVPATAENPGGALPGDFRYFQEVGYPSWDGCSTPDGRTIQRARCACSEVCMQSCNWAKVREKSCQR